MKERVLSKAAAEGEFQRHDFFLVSKQHGETAQGLLFSSATVSLSTCKGDDQRCG